MYFFQLPDAHGIASTRRRLRRASRGGNFRKMFKHVVIASALLSALVLTACKMENGDGKKISPVMNATNPPATHAHTNRLAREKSPYLLQHAHNPVDWFAWGDEAFEKARREIKPVFLSIGYSTCHWCHVMERESFESEDVAKFLNEHFVCIKVDREERPDVDQIYMTFVQARFGHGGWPLNVFLTPDLKPFFGGTYFPPASKYGQPAFLDVLKQISDAWQTRHEEVVNSAEQIHRALDEHVSQKQQTNLLLLTRDTIRDAGGQLKQGYDPINGGFGTAPKFPSPSHPSFLFRYGNHFKDDEAIQMVLHTCDRMAAGGIHDQLGGGFARYSVDAEWLVPHFEKMLYDNAQLLNLYLDAFVISGDKRHADVARDIIAYVLRDMTHPDGGFFSAEDADSEGHEGKFFCWTRAELEKLLAPDEFKVAVKYFGVTDKGNFVDHSHPTPLPNQNVLSVVSPLSGRDALPRVQADQQVGPTSFELLESAKEKMFAAREKRIRPHRDDKVLASWNGLMLGAMARAYAVLGDEKYRAAAERNLACIQAKLWVETGDAQQSRAGFQPAQRAREREHLDAKQSPPTSSARAGKMPALLFHRWRDGERDNVQLLDGYAFLLGGVIDLYEATLEPKHLDFAIALSEAMLAKFYDKDEGGFWQSPPDAKDLILRVKEDYDGAEPSGNSVAILALLKLGAITDRKDFRDAAEKSLRFFSMRLQQMPQAVPYMLAALDFSLEEPRRAVVAGDPRSAKARELLRAIHSVYQPNKVVLGNTGAVEEFARKLPAKDGAVVYLCTGTSCKPPTNEPEKVRELISSR